MRYAGLQGKAPPLSRRRMIPPTPLQNSFASFEEEQGSNEVEGRGWSTRERSGTKKNTNINFLAARFFPCTKFIGFLLAAVSMPTLRRELMIMCATRSSRCTLASTIVRWTSGNTLECATNVCGWRPRPASGASGPLAKVKRKYPAAVAP